MTPPAKSVVTGSFTEFLAASADAVAAGKEVTIESEFGRYTVSAANQPEDAA